MNKTTLTIFTLLLSLSTLLSAQTELVIEISSDRNPTETSWKLYDLEQTLIQESTVFAQETIHRDTIVLSDDNCYYWTLYDSYGDGFFPEEGDYKVYLDGELISEMQDPNFGDSISIYNLGQTCTANDIQITSFEVYDYLSKDEENITVNVLNMGSDPINSMEISYSVNDEVSDVVSVENLAIEVGAVAKVSYPTMHDFTSAGTYSLTFTIASVNSNTNIFIANNNIKKEVIVVDGFVLKNTIEHHASITNPYGPDADIAILGSVADHPESYTFLRYMTSPSYDLKYFPEIEFFFDYYSISNTPNVMLNGVKTDYKFFTPTFYSDYVGLASPFKISVDGYMKGDSLFATVEVVSNEDVSEALILRGSLLENQCFEMTQGASNNYPFYNVVYSLLTSTDGIPVESMEAGVPQVFTVSGAIINNPFEEGSLDDMRINFYLQNPTNREIFQSNDANIAYEGLNPEFTYNIENGAEDVDATDLLVHLYSNRILFDLEGRDIITISDFVDLKIGDAEGVTVPSEVLINENSNEITIEPEYGWDDNSTYFVITKSFLTFDDVLIPSDTLVFTTAMPIAVSDQKELNINLYPNPTHSDLTISNAMDANVEVVSMNGSVVKTVEVNSLQQTIDLSRIENGVYFVKVKTLQGDYIEKVIKN